MANLVALRIAQLQPADQYMDCNNVHITLQVEGGRVIEVMVSLPNNRATVGMPGSPAYRSVDLSKEEQDIVAEAARKLYDLSRAQYFARKEGESQQNALTILESLI
jgi:hypothetical protein